MKREKSANIHRIQYKGDLNSMEEFVDNIKSYLEKDEYEPGISGFKKKGIGEYNYEVIIQGARKTTNYVKHEINVVIKCPKIQEIKTNQGTKLRGIVTLEISGKTIYDWQEKLVGVWAKLQNFYEKVLIYKTIKDLTDYMEDYLLDYEHYIKKQLNMGITL